MLAESDSIFPFSSATTILDIGYGPGQVTNLLLKTYGTALPEHATIIAGDISPVMLDEIEKRKTQLLATDPSSQWKKVRSMLCNVQDMSEIPDRFISRVTAGLVLFFLPNVQDTMKEIKRVLMPGGVISFSAWKRGDWINVTGFVKVVRPDFTMLDFDPAWSSSDSVREILETSRFENIDAHYVESEWEYESPEKIVDYLFAFPGLQQLMNSWKTKEIEEVKSRGIAYLKEKYGSGHGFMKGTAVVGVSRKEA
jgi:ubiquinone/menaquinone biosynthesis C-methylase UbiE